MTKMFNRSAQVSFAGVSIQPITDLRIAFEVDKTDGMQFNHGMIEIYNLNQEARAKLAKPIHPDLPLVDPNIKVFLKAGYKDEEIQLIAGELMAGTNIKDGPDWITTLDVWSGIDAATKGKTNISFSEPTPVKTVVDSMLSVLNIQIRYTAVAEQILNTKRITTFSVGGLAFRETALFLRQYGLDFTIDEDGQGLVYVDDRPRNPNAGKNRDNTFSPQTGLIGSPSITRNGVEIRSLLRPRIRLLERIFVESESITGTLRGDIPADYFVTSLTHTGDTRGEDWTTSIVAHYSTISEGNYGDA